jgi:pimeloyl-ACP methyl ester carboxylesterase
VPLAPFLRPGRLIGLAVLIAAIVAGVVYGPWIAAQARAVGTLATAYETPVLSWSTRKLTGEPTLRGAALGGVPVTIAAPDGVGPWPAVLLLNGATGQGRFDQDVLRFALGLARVGHLVVLPDMPDITSGDLTLDVAGRTATVARALAARGDVRGGRISFVGLGLGATFALLAAEDERIADLTTLVLAVAPITDLKEMGRLVTTGYHRVPGGFVQPGVPSDLRLAAAQAIVAALPEGQERDVLAQEIAAIDPAAENPFGPLANVPEQFLSAEGAALVALLTNRDPRRYDALFEQLPGSIRSTLDELSPVAGARRLRARVEIAAAPSDPYVPLAQARALAREAPNARLTVSEAFSSTRSRLDVGGIGEIAAIDGLLVRSLRELRGE